MPSIKINVTPDAAGADEIAEEEAREPVHPQISLNARKTLDGKIMIMDHMDIDIVVDPKAKKIITFPKSTMTDEVYQTQNNYFEFLAKKGVIDRASVHSGDVFASMQGTYPDPIDEGISPTQVALLSTYQFIEKEKPRFETEEWLDNELDDYYTSPTPEDSTPLGEVPEEPEKGNIGPNNPWAYYSGYGY
jgi:hypothetical protein